MTFISFLGSVFTARFKMVSILLGETIWTQFENLEVEWARQNGINIASRGHNQRAYVSKLTFRHGTTDTASTSTTRRLI